MTTGMEYRNFTHFPSLHFDNVGSDEKLAHVFVLRMTYDILPDGTLRVADIQTPLVRTDEYYGEVGRSGVKQESDLVPFKPRCDVIVAGNAVAPGSRPANRFEAGVKMTRAENVLLDKRVLITGPREWKKSVTGWKLTEPAPVASVPLRDEYAYGGECRIDAADPAAARVGKKYRLTPEQRAIHPFGAENAPVAHACCETNFVGKGFSARWYLKAKKMKRFPAPQIESPRDPISARDKAYPPEGFGVVGKACLPRRQWLGTFDEAFLKSRKPLPPDFDPAYWQSARDEMQIPWVAGGEIVELHNIQMAGASSVSRFVLPPVHVCAKTTYESGEMKALDFNCDTLFIDAEKSAATLVYRLRVLEEPKIETLQTQIFTSEERFILGTHCEEVTQRTVARRELANA
jgi:hypothetical protein